MRFSNLKKAWDGNVEKWLAESLDLTPYQKEKMKNDEVVRSAPFYFYEEKEAQKYPAWRLTLLFFFIYWLISLLIVLPARWLFTGRYGYGRKFMDNFHNVWVYKLGL